MKRWRLLIIMILCRITISVMWCTSSSAPSDFWQKITFADYTMSIESGYQLSDPHDSIDHKLTDKIIAVYTKSQSDKFFDNIIISQDTLTPRASLEDYVQASIWGIAYTRGQYKSIALQTATLPCGKNTLPTVMNTFSIHRTLPSSVWETLYFVQYFLHYGTDVTIISLGSSQEDTVSTMQDMVKTISCIWS